MIIEFESDMSTREFVVTLANMIYKTHDHESRGDLMRFFRSHHPTEKACLVMAEEIYELLTGDSPEYLDEDDE